MSDFSLTLPVKRRPFETVSKFCVLLAYLYTLLEIYYARDSLLHTSSYFHSLAASVIGRLVHCFLLPFLNRRLSCCNLIQHETTYWSRQLRPSRKVYASPKMVYVSQDANASCASGTLVPSSCTAFRSKVNSLHYFSVTFSGELAEVCGRAEPWTTISFRTCFRPTCSLDRCWFCPTYSLDRWAAAESCD